MADALRARSKYLAWLSLLLVAVTAAMLLAGYRARVGLPVTGALAFLALFCMGHPFLKSYAFTAWVFAFVAASMFYPQAFMTWAGYDLKKLIVPLIQIIMFGMGTTLSLADFGRVLTMPWPVLVGWVLQFSVMPLIGFSLARLFGFEAEIAAGIVLIGSAPGGVASNVMAYLARGNVALSVTMTACSTLAAPLMTPLMMQLLAAQYVEISFLKMMMDICNMTIVPIVAGLAAHYILYGRRPVFQRAGVLGGLVCVTVVLAVVVRIWGGDYLGAVRGGLVVGLVMLAMVASARLVVDILLRGPGNWMDRGLPLVSMAGICLIIAIITARSAADLVRVGPLLIVAALFHNSLGYTLGYWGARLLRLQERDCRTVAIEVGMQNGGMASALAMDTLHSARAALAPAIFGPWMNISGSILATWWRRRPVKEEKTIADFELPIADQHGIQPRACHSRANGNPETWCTDPPPARGGPCRHGKE
jgi:BASS family bile acid:Na+ symporter